ncbi:sterol desaturase family protein [Kamptonema cortianum]|uniref:Sterol desaturase family protein n=1 Tax=Geitlerinema calcuttense NRMC-F 0142 TaxID=2922238 RepID=A0ABT7LXT2_9CYAN|nr:sterol desaturase family protein [Geitlerinema calcuttense]MDK3159289.1 sterol desaturase family protein [Kamptonema cortianum]MDL5056827.1 sterol desaturase family protein [Geitlerinema calcuttense NRMC-F 0142]
MLTRLIYAFVIFFVIFTPLELLFPLHSQKFFRRGWWADFLHFFVTRIFVNLCLAIAIFFLLPVLDQLINPNIQNLIAAQPFVLQLTIAVFVQELGAYFAHRLLHTVPFLWKFHAIHHSSEEIDWLSAARLHPLDQTFTRICGFIPLYILGFTKEILGLYIIVVTFNAIFIHANVRFKFGPLKWIIATPEFHRWHHVNDPTVYTKNLAGTFPVIDLIFGTLYLPKDKFPTQYGIGEPISDQYLPQLIHPFWKNENLQIDR